MKNHVARWVFLYATASLFSLLWMMHGVNLVPAIPEIFARGAFVLLLVLGALNVCLVSLSVSTERNLNTLPLLLSTPLTSFAICFAKWFAVMFRTTLLLVAVLPFVSLLFLEGGVAMEQVFATGFLTVCMLGVFTAVGVLSSVLYRKAGSGIILSFALITLGVILYAVLEEAPSLAPLAGGRAVWMSPFFIESRNHLVSWRIFELLVWGDPSVLGPSLPSLLLVQGVLHAGMILVLLMVSSRILRVMEQAKAPTFWAALRQGRTERLDASTVRDTPREPDAAHLRSKTPCRPWLASPYVWRSVSVRARLAKGSLRGTHQAALLLALAFLPHLLVVAFSTIQYAGFSAMTFLAGKGWPSLPVGYPWALSTAPYLDADAMRMTYRGTADGAFLHLTPDWVMGVCGAWTAQGLLLLLLVLMLAVPIQMAVTVSREREARRIPLLLVTNMPDHALSDGFWYEVLARSRAVFGVLAVMLLYAVLDPRIPGLTLLLIAHLALVCTYFWANLGMYAGLTTPTTSKALLKLGKYLGLVWGLPIPLTFLLIHLLDTRGAWVLGFLPLLGNPLFLLHFLVDLNPTNANASLAYLTLQPIADLHPGIVAGLFLLPMALAYAGRRVKLRYRGAFRSHLFASQEPIRKSGVIHRHLEDRPLLPHRTPGAKRRFPHHRRPTPNDS